MTRRLLLVEDDPAILAGLRVKLERSGFEIEAVTDGETARLRLADEVWDLIVLDIMLPGIDGLGVLRWLRKRNVEVPVLILSARGREEEKVEGLRAGADDYLAKPFGSAELLARIDALLRRTAGPREPVVCGDLTLDFSRRVVLRRGKPVRLSRKESDILFYLARHRDRVVRRDEILGAVWGAFAASADRAVDYHVMSLRRKLEADPADPRHILTHHGHGYQLAGQTPS